MSEPIDILSFERMQSTLCMQTGDWPRAIHYYSYIIEREPNNADAIFFRASCRARQVLAGPPEARDWTEAYQDASRFLALKSTNNTKLAEAHGICARYYHWIKQYDLAVTAYTRSIELSPDTGDYYDRGLCLEEMGRVLNQRQHSPAAIADFSMCIDQGFKLAVSLSYRATLYCRVKNWSASKKDYAQLAKLMHPESLSSGQLHLWAACCGEMGEYNEALRLAEAALKQTSDLSLILGTLVLQAYGLRKLGQHQQALTKLERCLQLLTDTKSKFKEGFNLPAELGQVYEQMGEVYLNQAKLKEAITSFTEAIKYSPQRFQPYRQRSLCRRANGDLKGGLEDINNAIRLKPNNADLHGGRGDCYRKLDRYSEALDEFSRALELNPDEALSYLFRAKVLIKLQAWAGALTDLNIFLDMQTRNPDYKSWWINTYLLRARCYTALGEDGLAADDRATAKKLRQEEVPAEAPADELSNDSEDEREDSPWKMN